RRARRLGEAPRRVGDLARRNRGCPLRLRALVPRPGQRRARALRAAGLSSRCTPSQVWRRAGAASATKETGLKAWPSPSSVLAGLSLPLFDLCVQPPPVRAPFGRTPCSFAN